MDFSNINKKKLAMWIIGVFTTCSLIFLGVQNIGTVAKAVSWVIGLIMPIILGFAFALVLDVPLRFFEKHIFSKTKKPSLQKMRRPLAFVVSIIVIIGIVAGVIGLVIPELVEAVKVIIQIVTDTVNKISKLDMEEISKIPYAQQVIDFVRDFDWKKALDSAMDWLKNRGGTIMNTAFDTIGSLVSGIVNVGVALVFACYVLLNKDKLVNQSTRLINAWLPDKFGTWLIHAVKVGNSNFRNFIAGQTLEAMILGVLCMIGMFILRIPYAPMVGALVGVTALIPVVGGFIGVGIGTFMILTVSPVKAAIFIVFFIVLQNVEGNFIYPKVMGNRVKLPAMWILAAVSIGGSIGGPLGMLLSVPCASTVYSLVKEATKNREEKLAAKMTAPVQVSAEEDGADTDNSLSQEN